MPGGFYIPRPKPRSEAAPVRLEDEPEQLGQPRVDLPQVSDAVTGEQILLEQAAQRMTPEQKLGLLRSPLRGQSSAQQQQAHQQRLINEAMAAAAKGQASPQQAGSKWSMPPETQDVVAQSRQNTEVTPQGLGPALRQSGSVTQVAPGKHVAMGDYDRYLANSPNMDDRLNYMMRNAARMGLRQEMDGGQVRYPDLMQAALGVSKATDEARKVTGEAEKNLLAQEDLRVRPGQEAARAYNLQKMQGQQARELEAMKGKTELEKAEIMRKTSVEPILLQESVKIINNPSMSAAEQQARLDQLQGVVGTLRTKDATIPFEQGPGRPAQRGNASPNPTRDFLSSPLKTPSSEQMRAAQPKNNLERAMTKEASEAGSAALRQFGMLPAREGEKVSGFSTDNLLAELRKNPTLLDEQGFMTEFLGKLKQGVGGKSKKEILNDLYQGMIKRGHGMSSSGLTPSGDLPIGNGFTMRYKPGLWQRQYEFLGSDGRPLWQDTSGAGALMPWFQGLGTFGPYMTKDSQNRAAEELRTGSRLLKAILEMR